MNFPTVITPMVSDVVDELIADLCSVEGAIGVLHGQPGSGKSHILGLLKTKFPSMPCANGNQSHLHTVVPPNPSGTGLAFIKEIHEEITGRRMHGVSSPNYVIGMTVKALIQHSISLLMVDEAQYIFGRKLKSLEYLLSVRDLALSEGHRLGILLATSSDPKSLLSHFPAASSRLLKSYHVRPLTAGEMTAVLKSFGVLGEDTPNTKALHKIFELTRGLFRKIVYFATLHKTRFPDLSPTLETVKKISERMDGQ